MEQRLEIFDDVEGFQWDTGNIDKNWERHRVLNVEAEQVFFNAPLLVLPDESHSTPGEQRFRALGRTDGGRYLFVVFARRKKLLRVISARDMSRKERKIYDEKG